MMVKRLMQLAVIYLVIGVLMGLVMGMTEVFTLRDVHAHVNLLGWASLAIMGFFYKLFPGSSDTGLARMHFWLHATGLPVLMIALAIMLMGHPALGPVVGIASLVTGLGVVAFCVNMLKFIK